MWVNGYIQTLSTVLHFKTKANSLLNCDKCLTTTLYHIILKQYDFRKGKKEPVISPQIKFKHRKEALDV